MSNGKDKRRFIPNIDRSQTNMIFYTLLGSYVITSMILFKYPTLLHKKKKIKFRARHISHRGGAGENYENTMIAFKRALELGTDMLELDCHLTKDEQVVVSHDQHLLRSTGIDKNISELNFSELPLLKTKLTLDFQPGEDFTGSSNEEERKFPLLKEVFETFPNVPINLDIKVNNDLLIAKVSDLIKQYNREDYTVWGNFSDEITQKCYKTNPNVNLLFSMRRVIWLMLYTYTGLLPFMPLKETHLEIFLPSVYLRCRKANFQFLPMERFFLSSVNLLLMRPFLFNHLKARGLHVYIWVINREDEYKEAFDLGATGVMTDYPSRLTEFLRKYDVDLK